MTANNTTAFSSPFAIYPIPYSIGSIVLNIFGTFGNVNIIIATIRDKNLKNKCNYLIAINAMFDFYTNIGFFQLSAYVFRNEMTMPNDLCYQRISHMNFAMNVGAFLIWIIGLDRLFAIKFPTR